VIVPIGAAWACGTLLGRKVRRTKASKSAKAPLCKIEGNKIGRVRRGCDMKRFLEGVYT
jgi:hypothetical protein